MPEERQQDSSEYESEDIGRVLCINSPPEGVAQSEGVIGVNKGSLVKRMSWRFISLILSRFFIK